MQTSCTKRRALEESSIRPTCSKLFERIAWGREGGREIETSQDGFVFLSPPLVSKKTNLMRQESRSLSRDNRRPSRRLLPPLISSPPRLWRASHTRRVEFVVESTIVPPWISSLWRIYPKGRGGREGIRVVRGYKLVGSKSVRFTFCPWILIQFQPCQFFHLLVILFFISGGENSENSGLLFSSSLRFNRSSSSFFEEFFERRLPF